MAEAKITNDPLSEKGRMTPFGERTFLGSHRVATRMRLYVFLAILAFGGAGGVFYYADRTLNLSDQKIAEASVIAQRAAEIEKQIWQLRNIEREYTLSKDPKHIGVYQSIVKSLNSLLGSLESIPSTKEIKEHIATVNDGVTQHAKAFERFSQHNDQKLKDRINKLAKTLGLSAKAVATRLTKVTISSLSDSFAHIRQTEARFKASGATAELRMHAKQIDEFNRLLATAPVSKKDRRTLKRSIKVYQNDMTAFAKVRLTQISPATRLDEIFKYLLPSLNGISSFANRQVATVQRTINKSRQMVRITVAAGIGAILIALSILTIILMQSLAAPIRAIAEGAEKLVKGERDTPLPALGNHDEIGEIARAINIFKEILAETTQLQQQLQTTRTTLKRTERTLHETQTEHKDAEEVATLALSTARTDIHATQQAIDQETAKVRTTQQALDQEKVRADKAQQVLEQEKARADKAQQALEQEKAKQASLTQPTPEPKLDKQSPTSSVPALNDAPIDSIAALSDRLAQSSQTASAAAFEAERTSTLIRGLNDAEAQLDKIEPLIRLIGKETNIPASNQPTGDTHRNLVALSADQTGPADKMDQDLRKRFDTVRKAAIQVLQTVRIVNRTVAETKGVALEIAAASSAGALEITSDLLEQSDNLRGMLNNLIGKLHSTSPPAARSASNRTPKQLAKPQIKPNVKPKMKPRVNTEAKAPLKPQVKLQAKSQTKSQAITKAKTKTKAQVKLQAKPSAKAKPRVKPQIRQVRPTATTKPKK